MTLEQLAPLARTLAWSVIGAGALIGGVGSLALALRMTRPKET